MVNMPYLPNFKGLKPPHGLEEALVFHRLGHGHLGKVGQLCHWISHGQYALLAQFQVSKASLWPRRGTCGSTDLVMTTLERLGNFVIGFLMANMPYLPNFRSLVPSHGLEEAPVVH